MKIVLITIVALLITSCTRTNMQKARQDFVCKDKGGVYKYANNPFKVMCRDGIYTEWIDVTLPPEYYPKGEQAP
jgi:hypothetical protein